MSTTAPFPSDAGLGKPVCVFCGSSPGHFPIFAQAAQAVGEALAKENVPVVYGGGRRGIMGVVSQATLQAGGYVHGVLPRALLARASEVTQTPSSSTLTPVKQGETVPGELLKSNEGLGKDLLEDDVDGRLSMEVVGSMHERKLKMAQLSSGGFIVLPGGYGTFEEMMEMITWNQLGIHRLPVVILNIGNFYTPVRGLLENAVSAGFIKPENLSLLKIVDLPGGSEANNDETLAAQWGPVTIKALREYSFSTQAGYGIEWNGTLGKQDGSEGKGATDTSFSLFTTLRYTSPDPSQPTLPIIKQHIPLLERHIVRLRDAHSYFAAQSADVWGDWPGDEVVWERLRSKLHETEKAQQGDWRVRLVLHPGGNVETQVVPAPAGAGPFQIMPEKDRPARRRPLIFDSDTYEPSSETDQDRALRLYKTTKRSIYDEASSRGAQLRPDVDHPEVLLHTANHLLESVTSNIALYLPTSDPDTPAWLTPRVHRSQAPFLDGVMRRELLERGIIREGEVTVADWEWVKAEGGRVIGFNGLRGVWEAEPV